MRETAKARQAWADYLAMGESRSLEKLVALYQSRPEPAPPTTQMTTLKVWSRTFGWQARLTGLADQAAATTIARRHNALETGLALDYERVYALKELADRLWKRILKKLELDVVHEYRGVLDDLAKETAGRQRVVKIDVDERIRRLAELLDAPYEEALAEVGEVLRDHREMQRAG